MPREAGENAEGAELRGEQERPEGEIDWSLTTFEGLRRKQHQEFAALSFAEKLERVEQMNEIVEMFAAARKAAQPSPESRPPTQRESR